MTTTSETTLTYLICTQEARSIDMAMTVASNAPPGGGQNLSGLGAGVHQFIADDGVLNTRGTGTTENPLVRQAVDDINAALNEQKTIGSIYACPFFAYDLIRACEQEGIEIPLENLMLLINNASRTPTDDFL